MPEPIKLKDLAERFSAKLLGDGESIIERVADIETAQSGSISFFLDKRFLAALKCCKASAVILNEKYADNFKGPVLVVDNPHLVFARISEYLHPDRDMQRAAGVSERASVADTAQVHPTAIVADNAIIEDDVQISEHVFIGPGCIVRQGSTIGAGSKLTANVTICHECIIGRRVIIHPAAVIGSDGFGLAYNDGKWIKIPQLGGVILGDDVEIGAGVAIDRGALLDTIIEDGVKLDNQIHVAHNVRIGENTVMAAQSGIAGSSSIGKNCAIGGSVGIVGHINIAENCRLNAFTSVTGSIKESGNYSSGTPLEEVSRWRKNYARFKQLDDMAKRLRELEKRVKELEKN